MFRFYWHSSTTFADGFLTIKGFWGLALLLSRMKKWFRTSWFRLHASADISPVVLLQCVDFQSQLQPHKIDFKRKWEFLCWTEGKASSDSVLKPQFSFISQWEPHRFLFLSPQFSPDVLHIAENSKEHEVTIHSTVPIPCFTSNIGHQCGVPLALTVNDPGQTCGKTGDWVQLEYISG